MTVEGYKWATCLCLNDEVVHGIPRDMVLKIGDLFTIDTGARYKGWCTDTAWTIKVGGGTNKLLSVGEEAMWAGIKQARAGNRVGDISAEMQRVIEKENGFCVVRSLVGHGIGKTLHEDPQIPGYGRKGTGPILVEGMTVAIEAIYSESSLDVKMASDGWTYLTEDGSMAGMFEMSVIVGATGPEVLTDWRKA
jgi:methionyl aminopeptidase